MTVRRTRGGHGGFTLLELLVVLGVAGILIGISARSVGPMVRSTRFRAGVQDVSHALRTARQLAVVSGEVYCVSFRFEDGNKNGIWEPGPPRDEALTGAFWVRPKRYQYDPQDEDKAMRRSGGVRELAASVEFPRPSSEVAGGDAAVADPSGAELSYAEIAFAPNGGLAQADMETDDIAYARVLVASAAGRAREIRVHSATGFIEVRTHVY